jgi:hypothetical protein
MHDLATSPSQSGQMTPLTEKDLSYMKDQMSWELVATKKAFQYAHQTQDADCQQLMLQVAQKHQTNMERLLQHLGEHVQLSAETAAHTPQTGAQPTTPHLS